MALSDLTPRIYAAFVRAMVGAITMPRLVGNNLSVEVADFGETIRVPIDEEPNKSRAIEFKAALTPAAANAPNPGYTDVVLDQHREVSFQLTDKQLAEVRPGTVPSAVRTEAASLAMYVNNFMLEMALESPHIIDISGGNDGFDNDALKPIRMANSLALRRRWPSGGLRYLILSPDDYGDASTNSRLTDFDGTGRMVGEGVDTLGTQRGYNWIGDPLVPTPVSETRKTGATFLTSGAHTAGARSLTIDAIGGDLYAGDVLSVANNAQIANVVGVVSKMVEARGTTVNLFHGALREVDDDTQLYVVSNVGNRVNNIAFTPGAFAFGARSITGPENTTMDVTEADPITGLPVTMRVWRGHGLTRWGFSMLFGGRCVDQHRVFRLVR